MALLNVYNLKMEFGERLLFSGASFEIGDNDKVGVIGANGTGKTTLFKLITGEMAPSSGEIYKSKNAVVGYMEQHACSDSKRSLYSEVLTVFEPLMEIEDELEEIAFKIESQGANDEILERQAQLTEKFEREGGLTFRSRAKAAIIGLGFLRWIWIYHAVNLAGDSVQKSVWLNFFFQVPTFFFWTSLRTIWILKA